MEVIAQTFPLRSSLTLKLTVDGLISELAPLGDGVGFFPRAAVRLCTSLKCDLSVFAGRQTSVYRGTVYYWVALLSVMQTGSSESVFVTLKARYPTWTARTCLHFLFLLACICLETTSNPSSTPLTYNESSK